ncbi:MAG: methyltransferase family protein [Capsulimonadaceae bacterium]
MLGAAVLTYGVGVWIIAGNSYFRSFVDRDPLTWGAHIPMGWTIVLAVFAIVVGRTPIECMIHLAVIASLVQAIKLLDPSVEHVGLKRYRPYVLWHTLARFMRACLPFLLGRNLSEPKTFLREYERVTARYFLVKLIFVPFLIGIFYGNLQDLLNRIDRYRRFTPNAAGIGEAFMIYYMAIMVLDVAWFCTACAIETPFGRIRTVDPYASGWFVTLICYPPMVVLAGQFFPWTPPLFPDVASRPEAIFYAVAGIALFTLYVVADLTCLLKAGNLTYRGLVDRGPYSVVRHPMYTSKTLAWCLFTLPGMAIHWQTAHLSFGAANVAVPMLTGQFQVIGPMIAWVAIYALRAITEERYLLRYREYREYCKRVKYRFIPGLL